MTRQSIEAQIEALTHKWAADLGGKDVRIPLGAVFNILSTLGNYSPSEVRSATAMFLRRIAGELESRRDQ